MSTAADYFREIAPKYDAVALRGMPRYEEMLSQIVRYLPEGAGEVLELGCGTGALTYLLAERYPDARVTAVDAAREMIDLASERLRSTGRSGDRVTFVVSLFEALDLPLASYDLIASNMSLHHIVEKGPYYRRLCEALRPAGFLVLGDELKGGLEQVQTLNSNAWLEFARQEGHLSEQEITEIIAHEQEFDRYETLVDQVDMLRSAGFSAVDCVWRYLNYAVFVARA